jgi:hypothetical protein
MDIMKIAARVASDVNARVEVTETYGGEDLWMLLTAESSREFTPDEFQAAMARAWSDWTLRASRETDPSMPRIDGGRVVNSADSSFEQSWPLEELEALFRAKVKEAGAPVRDPDTNLWMVSLTVDIEGNDSDL